MSDFEAKHPRSRDGKFTEKARKESDLTLELDDTNSENGAEDLERGEIFIGEHLRYMPVLGNRYVTQYEYESHDKIPSGQWQLSQKVEMKDGSFELTYHHKNGIVVESFDKDGRIEKQVFMDSKFDRLQDTDKWTEKNWNKDGVLTSRQKDFFPKIRNEETFKPVSKAVDEAGGSLVVSESFSGSGAIEYRRTWFKQGGQLYQSDTDYNEDGSIKSMGITDFNQNGCAPENTPSFIFYQDGKVSLAEYMVVKDGESVYHRTDGSAIYNRFAPEGKPERYFLEGAEHTRRQWEKKTGNRTSWLSTLRGN